MAWSTPSMGVAVYKNLEDPDPTAVIATSTATLALNWQQAGATPVARMFGMTPQVLNTALGSYMVPPASPPSTCPLTDVYSVQEYLDSWTDGVFRVIADDPSTYSQPTCVPFERKRRNLIYTAITQRRFYDEPTYDYEADTFYTVYKDLHVTRLPAALGGGYVMFAARLRVKVSDVSDAESDDLDPNLGATFDEVTSHRCDPGTSISDLVCFLSSDSKFSDVRGPFPLLSSLAGVVDVDGTGATPAFRMWLGVPAGFFNGGDLYLYYSAQPDVTVKPPIGQAYVDTDTNLAASIAHFARPAGAVRAAFGTIDDVTARTCVARFRQDTLAALFAEEPDEAGWDWPGYWPDFELGCPTRLFARTRNAAGTISAEHFEEYVGSAGNPAWIVDATPLPCCFGDLALYVSVQPRWEEVHASASYSSGMYGIWVARAVPEGHPFADPDGTVGTFGRDFYVDPDDQLAVSGVPVGGGPLLVYKDPDPWSWSGGISVFAGNDAELTLMTTDGGDCLAWAAAGYFSATIDITPHDPPWRLPSPPPAAAPTLIVGQVYPLGTIHRVGATPRVPVRGPPALRPEPALLTQAHPLGTIHRLGSRRLRDASPHPLPAVSRSR